MLASLFVHIHAQLTHGNSQLNTQTNNTHNQLIIIYLKGFYTAKGFPYYFYYLLNKILLYYYDNEMKIFFKKYKPCLKKKKSI